jgi:cell division septal protein FtsQ
MLIHSQNLSQKDWRSALLKVRQRRAITLSIILFSILVYIVAWSPLLTVKSISYSGIPAHIKVADIKKVISISEGERLSRIEPRVIEEKLTALGWIDSARISRNWIFGKVDIEIHPKVAVGIFRGQGIDEAGELFDFAANPPKGLPEVTATSTEIGLAAINLFKVLPAELRDNLLAMSARNASDISSQHIIKKHRITIHWGDSQDLALKIKVLDALLALPENKKISKVDLSAPHAPIVK